MPMSNTRIVRDGELNLDTPEGVVQFWHLHLGDPEQDLESMVCSCARLVGYRAYPEPVVPALILDVPQLHRAWASGWNQALRNSRFDYDKWVEQGCP